MRHIVIGTALLAASPILSAKPCEELGAEISAKIESKGVRGYSLKLMPVADATEGSVVGTCDGGASKLVYRRR
ncbi:MAG TPA: DUF1161 domain-containing protein [Solimonas sp.]|nr:DUF1161 domain-containing protein [Solimonas sp.]